MLSLNLDTIMDDEEETQEPIFKYDVDENGQIKFKEDEQ